MRVLIAGALLGCASLAGAECPNFCSGHGYCGDDMVCTCFDGWMFADCSERICPYEIAFADEPNADGSFHNYVECSGRGICDRDTGECECLEGYTGKACKRMACPSDCSGHGTCERMKDLTYTSSSGSYFSGTSASTSGLMTSAKSFGDLATKSWEWDKAMACKCDPGYIDVDCSRRMCPRGNDAIDNRLDTSDTFLWQKQRIILYAAGTNGGGASSATSDFAGGDFALTFVSKLNETYTTGPIAIADTDTTNLKNDIRAALLKLPNKVIDDVNVYANFAVDVVTNMAELIIEVEFTGSSVQGEQNLLMVNADKCGDGCSPKLKGLNLISYTDSTSHGYLSFVTQSQVADHNSYECGRRGKCDYDEGICECFEGYMGLSCQNITALV